MFVTCILIFRMEEYRFLNPVIQLLSNKNKDHCIEVYFHQLGITYSISVRQECVSKMYKSFWGIPSWKLLFIEVSWPHSHPTSLYEKWKRNIHVFGILKYWHLNLEVILAQWHIQLRNFSLLTVSVVQVWLSTWYVIPSSHSTYYWKLLFKLK